MSDARPTKEFTTTSGNYKAVLNQFITGAENRQIRSIYAKAIRSAGGAEKVEEGTEFEADNKAIELAVISIEGPHLVGETVVEKVLSMPIGDFRELVAEIEEVIEGKKKSEN